MTMSEEEILDPWKDPLGFLLLFSGVIIILVYFLRLIFNLF